MSENKHVFKIAPGKVFDNIEAAVRIKHKIAPDKGKIARIEFKSLDSESTIKPELQVRVCTIRNNGKLSVSCMADDGKGLVNVEDKTGSNSFLYYDDKLMHISFITEHYDGRPYRSYLSLKPVEYQAEYVTWEELDNKAHKCYFSDNQGNDIGWSYHNDKLQSNVLLKDQVIANNLISSNRDIILSDAFAKAFIKDLTEKQLKTLAYTLSDKQLQKIISELNLTQLQVVAEHLTDTQFRALVDHLTNHQLHTLAQELNPEKLQIIVPILNDEQLGVLVKDLHPEQVKEILPHLKIDQFKALINNIDDYQLVELAKDLDERHLTILSKELWHEQFLILVHTLEGDKLNDLVNNLDNEKLTIVAQDLTDPSRIKIIIESLVTNSEKLQIFAHSISDQQLAELLNVLDAEELKDIIHKLPYEKVIPVISDLGSKDQFGAIIKMLKEQFKEQNEKQAEIIKMFNKLEVVDDSKIEWDSSPNLQDTNTALMEMEEYVHVEHGI